MSAVVLLAAVAVCLTGVESVRITQLVVPSIVLNGSVSSVVLDCIYQLDSPNNTASGLVVKWYHNRGPTPVYQWIPGYPPQAFGPLRGHVNLGHVVSDDPLTRHRAIQLVRPRPELSGEFTCKVTTWSDVATSTKRMVIYAPVKSMSLSSSKPSSHRVTLSCEASGVYPEPEVSVVLQTSHTRRERLRGLQVTKALVDGAYSVRVTKELDDREIPSQCVIHCQLTLPHTGYSVTEKISHIRGVARHSTTPILGRKQKFTGRSLRRLVGSSSRSSASSGLHSVLLFGILLRLLGQFHDFARPL